MREEDPRDNFRRFVTKFSADLYEFCGCQAFIMVAEDKMIFSVYASFRAHVNFLGCNFLEREPEDRIKNRSDLKFSILLKGVIIFPMETDFD